MKMSPESPCSAAFDDPRSRSDFRPQHYPRVNSQDAPLPDAKERNDRMKLEFAAAYYALNGGYAGLLEARSRPDAQERREAEKQCLQAIEQILILRDRLEDQYAPFGVIAEPVVQDGFTVDMRISFGNVDAAGRRRSEEYTLTAQVPIPWPKRIRFEDLPIRIEGPGINPE
jgi:hypothetical protein